MIPRGPAAAGLLCCLCCAAALTGAEDDYDKPEFGKSAIPIVGYDDKSGWLYGAAGFLYSDKEPGVNAGLFFVSNLGNFNSATFNIEERSKGPWSWALHLLGERAFDLYYGEGDLTPALDPKMIHMAHFEARPSLYYRFAPHLRAGPYIDFRSRVEAGSQVFPNEASGALGLSIQWDTRDKINNTRKGDFFQLNAERNPALGGVSQASMDLRRFLRLGRTMTLASRIEAGTSWGQPSYLYEYRLGGLDLLRGYKDNRFRGTEFFASEEELRWILKKWLSVNVSVDAGGIRAGTYHQLKASAQAGLRVGLPPDWGQKMRIDFGMGADQSTFQIQFGEVF
ncbi:MAG TPA: BamA/TamA family outer membrane protein [bacterium]|nr:BamA/TamA family outer membrane protein [bacterium]